MKKVIAWLIVLASLVSYIAIPTSAEETENAKSAFLRVEGTTLATNMCVEVTEKGFMVPLRPVLEKKNTVISWYGDINTAKVTLGGVKYLIPVGEDFFYAGEEKKECKQKTSLYGGTLYVDATVIEAITGLTVYYEKELDILDFIGANSSGQAAVTKEESAYDKNVKKIIAFEDTYVVNSTGGTDTNYGSATDILFKYVAGEGNTWRRAYLKFDLSGAKVSNLNNVKLKVHYTVSESGSTPIETILYDVANPNSWQENTLTYNTKVPVNEKIAEFEGMRGNDSGVDITDYIKKQIESGKKVISIAIDGGSGAPQNSGIASRENGNDEWHPMLMLDYNNPEDYEIYDNYPTPEWGRGIAPLTQARISLEESGATYKYGNDTMLAYPATETVQIKYNDPDSYAGEKTMSVQYRNDSVNNAASLVKFDLSEMTDTQVGGAYVQAYCKSAKTTTGKRKILLRELPSGIWSEKNASWYNVFPGGNIVSTGEISNAESWLKLDVTDSLNEKLKKGEKNVSYMLCAYDDFETKFATRYDESNAPKLVILGSGEEPGSQKLEQRDYSSQYTERVDAKLNPSIANFMNEYTAQPTRLMSSMSDYKAVTEPIPLSKYGGDMRYRIDEGTGYFRCEKIDGRWRLIDPEGYYFYSMAKVTVRANEADPNAYREMYKTYGSNEGWMSVQRKHYKDLGFNSLGAWSSLFKPWSFEGEGNFTGPLVMDAIDGDYAMPISQVVVYGTGITYQKAKGDVHDISGQEYFISGIPAVFNPDYEEECGKIIDKFVSPWKENPYVMGFFTDNEIADSKGMLDAALGLDPTDEKFAYTHAAAWEWLRERTGKKNASVFDVDNTLRQEFREYVYDRYHRIMKNCLDKSAPNHMYLGIRFMKTAYDSPASFTAAARYCDVISVNLYTHWTPNIVDTWAEYVDAPILITEWYAKTGSAVGGFICRTEEDCGKFYQHFALRCMEAKNVVGLQYFSDILPGMYPYVKELNANVYDLIKYFDGE